MKEKVEIIIRDHIMHVQRGNEFATMTRRPGVDGLIKITFSIPMKGSYADIIDGSGIATVDNINYDECSISFSALPFFETHLMAELIADILSKHEENS